MRSFAFALVLSLLLAAPAMGADKAAEKPTREDISECLYNKGEIKIPVPFSTDAGEAGYIYRFEKQGFGGKVPKKPDNVSEADLTTWLVERMRTSKMGDVFYSAQDSTPVLWVISGKARDLGKKYLYEFNGQKIDPPGEWPPADPKHGTPVSGWIKNPESGHVYLIETVDATHVLFRVVALGDGAIVLQWIAPSDKMAGKWEIPGGLTSAAEDIDVELPRKIPATRVVAAGTHPGDGTGGLGGTMRVGMGTPPTTRAVALVGSGSSVMDNPLTPNAAKVASLLRDRETLTKSLVAVVSREPINLTERTAKAAAMTQLGLIGATETADMLAAQVLYMDPSDAGMTGDPLKAYPAVGALILMGKPGTNAALKAMHETKKNPNPLLSPTVKSMLLGTVVRRVEGDELAEVLFKKEMDKADGEHKGNFEQAIREMKGGGN